MVNALPGDALKRPPRPSRHTAFSKAYLHLGLIASLSSGFGLAAYLAAHLGFGLSISAALPAVIQVHGHTQVFGWLGLFIMGVSLHFLPRLSGVPLVRARFISVPGCLVASALALRTAAQPALSLGDPAWGRPALALAGVTEAAGVLAYVTLIVASLHAGRLDPASHPTIGSLRPLLFTAMAGWLVSGGLMAVGTVAAGLDGRPLVDPGLHLLAADTFVAAVLMPVVFVFARQTFPLYLQIEPSRVPPALFAVFYAGITAIELASRIATDLAASEAEVWPVAGHMAAAVRGAIILWFIAGLRLHRKRELLGTPRRDRDGRTRYGRIAPLIYAAFVLLAAAAVAQSTAAAAALLGEDFGWRAAGLRHAYLAGFGTLLILGVAPRMIPGFLGARGPAFPRLVLPPLFLAAPAAVGASLGLLLPTTETPEWLRILFACSGMLGWAAIALLAANLWTTVIRTGRPVSRTA